MSSAFDVVKHFLGSVGGDVGDYLDKNREADKNLRENPSPGTAFDAAKQVVGGFLHLMGTGAKEVAYPVAGALAKEGQNPAAISPLRPGNLVRGPIGPVQVLGTEVVNAFLHHYGVTNGEPNAVQRAILPPGVDTNLDRQTALKAQFAPSNTAAAHAAFQGHPLDEFLVTAMLDPLNYVGAAGEASSALEAARAARAAEGSRSAAALLPLTRAAEIATHGTERVMGLPFEGAGKALKQVGRLPFIGGYTGEQKVAQGLRGLQNLAEENRSYGNDILSLDQNPENVPVGDLQPAMFSSSKPTAEARAAAKAAKTQQQFQQKIEQEVGPLRFSQARVTGLEPTPEIADQLGSGTITARHLSAMTRDTRARYLHQATEDQLLSWQEGLPENRNAGQRALFDEINGELSRRAEDVYTSFQNPEEVYAFGKQVQASGGGAKDFNNLSDVDLIWGLDQALSHNDNSLYSLLEKTATSRGFKVNLSAEGQASAADVADAFSRASRQQVSTLTPTREAQDAANTAQEMSIQEINSLPKDSREAVFHLLPEEKLRQWQADIPEGKEGKPYARTLTQLQRELKRRANEGRTRLSDLSIYLRGKLATATGADGSLGSLTDHELTLGMNEALYRGDLDTYGKFQATALSRGMHPEMGEPLPGFEDAGGAPVDVGVPEEVSKPDTLPASTPMTQLQLQFPEVDTGQLAMHFGGEVDPLKFVVGQQQADTLSAAEMRAVADEARDLPVEKLDPEPRRGNGFFPGYQTKPRNATVWVEQFSNREALPDSLMPAMEAELKQVNPALAQATIKDQVHTLRNTDPGEIADKLLAMLRKPVHEGMSLFAHDEAGNILRDDAGNALALRFPTPGEVERGEWAAEVPQDAGKSWAQIALETPASDPRWRAYSAERRAEIGKQSLQPSFTNYGPDQQWNEALYRLTQREGEAVAPGATEGALPGEAAPEPTVTPYQPKPTDLNFDPFAAAKQQFEAARAPKPPTDFSAPVVLNDKNVAYFNLVRDTKPVKAFYTKFGNGAYTLREALAKVSSLPEMPQLSRDTELADALDTLAATLPGDAFSKVQQALWDDMGFKRVIPMLQREKPDAFKGITDFEPKDLTGAFIRDLGSPTTKTVGDWEFKLYQMGLQDSAEQALAEHYGVDLSKMRKGPGNLSWLGTLIRRTGLMTIRNPLQNLTDVTIKSIISGVPLRRSYGATALASDLDTAIPDAALGINTRAGRGIVAEMQGGDSPWRRLDSAGVFRPLAKLDEIRAAWDIRIDTHFRAKAWSAGTARALDNDMPGFLNHLESAGRDAGLTDSIVDHLPTDKPYFSARDVAQAVKDAGGDDTLARDLSTAWQGRINNASQEGIRLANKVHYDFTDVHRGDEWARKIFLYHFWATRNIPFWLDAVAKDPVLYNLYRNYEQVAQQQQQATGESRSRSHDLARFVLPMFVGKDLFGAAGGLLTTDPSQVFSIRGQMQDPYSNPDQSGVGGAIQRLSALGLPVAPWWENLATMAGFMGSASPRDYFRYSQFLGDVGDRTIGHRTDPETLITRFEQAVQQVNPWGHATQTVSGDPYRDYQIDKQIREILVQAGMSPTDPMGAEAMADPRSPLYQAAEDKVDNQNILRFLSNIVSPIQVHTETQTEAASRQAGVPLSGQVLNSDQRSQAMQQMPLATLYWGMPNDKREAEIRAGQALLHSYNPIAWNYTPLVQQVAQQYPEFGKYETWHQAAVQAGQNSSVTAYLGQLATPDDLNNLRQAAQRKGLDNTGLQLWLSLAGSDPTNLSHSQAHFYLSIFNQPGPLPTPGVLSTAP